MSNAGEERDPPGPGWTWVERDRPFGESWLWDLQRAYYSGRGVDAWRTDGVPQYVTSSRAFALAYAKLIRAWGGLCASADAPQVVVELGAGSGRFAHQVLRCLDDLTASADDPGPRLTYVMTDVAESNIDSWLHHPQLQPFFEAGRLEVARFDVHDPGPLMLSGGRTVSPEDRVRCPVVIANYVFDSIPQDMFFLRDRELSECLSSIVCKQEPSSLPVADVVASLMFRYSHRGISGPVYPDATHQRILDLYVEHLDSGYFLFPKTALRSIDYLRSLADGGMLVLAADKGEWRLDQVLHPAPPVIVEHSSFSINVNFHAMAEHCEDAGGTALFPGGSQPAGVTIAAFIHGADDSVATRFKRDYESRVRDFGPDDHYRLLRLVADRIAELEVGDIFAVARFVQYDPWDVQPFLERLTELAPAMTPSEREFVVEFADRTWTNWFALGDVEQDDLAFQLGCLCYQIGAYEKAMEYFGLSIDTAGASTGAVFNIAACLHQLGRAADASELLPLVLEHDPANVDAASLLAVCRARSAE